MLPSDEDDILGGLTPADDIVDDVVDDLGTAATDDTDSDLPLGAIPLSSPEAKKALGEEEEAGEAESDDWEYLMGDNIEE